MSCFDVALLFGRIGIPSGGLAFSSGVCEGVSTFFVPDTSLSSLHLASKYDNTHRSMIALVRSTDSGSGLGGGNAPARFDSLFSFSETCSSIGCRSFTVKQHMHLNFSNSFGTLTLLSQHMHLRFNLSSSSTFVFFPLIARVGVALDPPSKTGTRSSSKGTSVSWYCPMFGTLFFRLNILGSGWLTERLCVCDLESPDACALGGEAAAAPPALSPSLPARVGGGSKASDGGRGRALSLPLARDVLLRVGVPVLCSSRDDHDEGIAMVGSQRSLT